MQEQKKALVIAGGIWQTPIIKYLQERKYEVTVVDPYPTAVGVLIADKHIQADVRDTETILNKIADKEYHIVTTDQSDISVKTVALLASHFGLAGNAPAVVNLFTNKYLSRDFAAKIGVPVPVFRKAESIQEIEKAIEETGLPAILKPADSQSSRGIAKIDKDNLHALPGLFKNTLEATRENYILVESFFEGMELTAEGICIEGKHKTLAISQKKHFRTGIASDLEYPARIPNTIEQEIIRLNDLYVEQSGLRTAITHAEYLYNANTGKICLVEIACRGGGTLISSDIAQWVSGINLYKILIDGLEGNPTNVKSLVPQKKNALLHFFEFPNGKVTRIEGIDAIHIAGAVAYLQLDFKEGDIIQSASDDRSRQGFAIILADSATELDNKFNLVTGLLKVTVQPN